MMSWFASLLPLAHQMKPSANWDSLSAKLEPSNMLPTIVCS